MFPVRRIFMVSPDVPGRLAGVPELLEKVLVAQGVPRPPEAVGMMNAHLPLGHKALERFALPDRSVALDIVGDLRAQDEIAAVDPAAVLRLLAEADHLRPVGADDAESPLRLGGREGGEPALAPVERDRRGDVHVADAV